MHLWYGSLHGKVIDCISLEHSLFLFKGVLFRPETVGEGNHRFFMSNNLRNADPSFAERISKDLNTAAIQIAGRSFPEGRPHKTSRAHTIRENSAMAPSTAGRIPSPDTTIRLTQTSRCLDVIGTSIPSCAARDTSVAGIVQPKQFPLEKNMVASFVDLLK